MTLYLENLDHPTPHDNVERVTVGNKNTMVITHLGNEIVEIETCMLSMQKLLYIMIVSYNKTIYDNKTRKAIIQGQCTGALFKIYINKMNKPHF